MKNRLLMLVGLLLVGCSLSAAPPTGVLTWTPPTTYSDGSPLGAAAITYAVYQGPAKAETKVISGLTTLTYTATVQAGATVCWTVTASVAGLESVPSAEVCKSFSPVAPSAPGNVAVK